MHVGTRAFPPSLQVVPLLTGGLLLGRRAMRPLLGVVVVALVPLYCARHSSGVAPGAVVAVAVAGLFAWESARSRDAYRCGRHGG